jgi:lysophospholipid acyltransferase (LPLAT)-like uncharacterized protein
LAEASGAAQETDRPDAPFKVRLAAFLAAGLLRALRATLRLRFDGEEQIRAWERGDRRVILAFWHRHLLLMPWSYRGKGISVLVSRSKDGELIARAVAHLGIATARGSSSRAGAIGLHALLRQARSGMDIAFTPDGPRGPALEVQPGVLMAAKATGWPIVPVALGASRSWRLRSWDRMLVPKPGARLQVCYGEPLTVPREASIEPFAAELKQRLDACEARAEGLARGSREPVR